MACFIRLTRHETGRELWLNADHVTEMCGNGVATTLRAASGGVWIVRETPEHIAFMAAAEYPQPVR